MATGSSAHGCCGCPDFWTVLTSVAAALTALGMLGNLGINIVQALRSERRYKHKLRANSTLPTVVTPPLINPMSCSFVDMPFIDDSRPGMTATPHPSPIGSPPLPEKVTVIERGDHEAFIRDLVKAMHDDRLGRLEHEVLVMRAWHEAYGNMIDGPAGRPETNITRKGRPGEDPVATGFELRRRGVRSG